MIQGYREMKWTILVSMLLGILLSPLSGLSPLAPMYDFAWPVVEMQGKVVDRGPDFVTIHMFGRKNRECKFEGIQGFSKQSATGLSRDATGTRLDMPSVGATKPKGEFDIGIWQFRPVSADAKIIEVYSQHDCGGRTIVTRIARAEL